MSLEIGWLWAFALVFVRCSAMLLASPFFGQWVPVPIRVASAATMALALSPVLRPHLAPMPTDMATLVTMLAYEVAAGLLIGALVHLVLLAAQMAGAFLDMQIGLGQTQLLNPTAGTPVSLLAQFYFILGTVLLFSVNGHHIMLRAFADSYALAPGGASVGLEAASAGVMTLVPMALMLALQIAAPVAGVTVVIDAAAGIVNKSVPTMPVYLVALPVKIVLGIVVLTTSLPMFATLVNAGLEHTMQGIYDLFASGAR